MRNEEIEKIKFGDWPLSEDYLTEIGRISTLWSSLEHLLNLCLAKLAGYDIFDPKHYILFAHTSFPQKLDMLGSLVELHIDDYPHLKKFPEVQSKLKDAQKRRNRYIHNGITYNKETQQYEMPQGSARGKLKTRVEAVTKTDLKRAIIAIDEANRSLYKLILQKELPPAWQKNA